MKNHKITSLAVFTVVSIIVKATSAVELQPVEDTSSGTTADQSSGTLRCFCNLPICASTNFMCLTNNLSGGCFSEIHQFESEARLPKHHGCVEFLKKNKTDLVCDNVPRKHSLAPPFGEILVLCCQENLCNYLHYEANQKQQTTANRDTAGFMSISQNNDLWFKVAIIIVPILGIIIVILLIILAIKMLKADGIEPTFKTVDNLEVPKVNGGYNFKPQEYVIYDNEANSSLLVQPGTSCDKKNENLAKRNQLLSLEYRLLPSSFQDPGVKFLNTEDGVINNTLSKNFNNALQKPLAQKISNNVKEDKLCEKEFLNLVGWNC